MTTGRRLNARLSSALAGKVAALGARTHKSTTTIGIEALDLYCAAMEQHGGDPVEILEQAGFIASGSGPADLSRRYKAQLAASWRKKT